MTGIRSVAGMVYIHSETADLLPLVDIYETSGSLVFKIDLPGIDPDEVLIKAYYDIVIIEGLKKKRHEEKERKYLCVERNFSSFRRIIKLPVPVIHGEGRASYTDGVITLRFPKLRDKAFKIKIDKINKEGFPQPHDAGNNSV